MPQSRVVHSSVEFRDAVMEFAKGGRRVYARSARSESPTRRIVLDESQINLQSLVFDLNSPVLMETFASAMVRAKEDGQEIPAILVFARPVIRAVSARKESKA